MYEANIVSNVDFDCGITFQPETPTEIRRINRERNYNSRSCEKPSAFPVTINITVLLISSITQISFWTNTIYGTWFQHLLCHSTTLRIDTLCPIGTLNHQLTHPVQTHIWCSLHWERWTVNGGIASELCFLLAKLLNRRTSERNSCYGWRIEWHLEIRNNGWKYTGLRWTVIASKCSFLLQLFDFYCLREQCLSFFLKIYFFVPFLWWPRKRSSMTISM